MPRHLLTNKNRESIFFKWWLLIKISFSTDNFLISQMKYKPTLFTTKFLFSFSKFLHFSVSHLSFLHCFVLSFNKGFASHQNSVPGTEDAIMHKTQPLWNLHGGTQRREQRHTIQECTNGLVEKGHEKKIHSKWVHFTGVRTHNGGSGSISTKGMEELGRHSRSLHLLSVAPHLIKRESLGFWSLECPSRLANLFDKVRHSRAGIGTKKLGVALFFSCNSCSLYKQIRTLLKWNLNFSLKSLFANLWNL